MQPDPVSFSFLIPDPCSAGSLGLVKASQSRSKVQCSGCHKDLLEDALLHGSFLVSAYNPAWGCSPSLPKA